MKFVQIISHDGKFGLKFASKEDLIEAIGGMKSVNNTWVFLTDNTNINKHSWGIPRK